MSITRVNYTAGREHFDWYCSLLRAALEPLGYTAQAEETKGHDRTLEFRTKGYNFKNVTVHSIGAPTKWFMEVERLEVLEQWCSKLT